jgi:hypothetical protein
MLTLNQLRYGKSDPLPQSIPLRAGPLSLLYEDGDLRSIKLGNHELIRRIYAAVRDRNWGTILPQFSNVFMDISNDCFSITYKVVNQLDDIHFNWQGLLQGEPDGSITFCMEGQAVTTFMKNRIGLCVLHPAGLAGMPCTIMQVDGSQYTAAFPNQITPDQPPLPFTDIARLSYAAGAAQVAIHFDGETFEMEDQRNWSDASFKTFCPPLRFPYPNEITAGTKVSQTVTIRTSQIRKNARLNRTGEAGLTLNVSQQSAGRLPALGTGIASHGSDLTRQEITRLKALRLSHLRADVRLFDPRYVEGFYRAVVQSQSLGIPLYLAVHISENGEEELHGFAKLFHEVKPQVALWLVYPAREIYRGGSPTARVVGWVRNSEIARLAKLPVYLAAGTDHDFIFLQRNLPPFDQIEAVCFAINPQVHTFDNACVMETIEAQRMMVASARDLAGEHSVVVSPVTLRPRHNPYASGPIPATPPGELPPQVDYRQPSLFTAAWLVGSLRAMALGGANAVTYFETTGWRGLMETDAGSPVPGKFHSIPGAVFPVYHMMADVADFAVGTDVLAVTSSDNLLVQGLALRSGEQVKLLVANLTPAQQAVTVNGLPDRVRVRLLDETKVEEAMRSPEAFRLQPPTACTTVKSGMKLDLFPYAVVTLDLI